MSRKYWVCEDMIVECEMRGTAPQCDKCLEIIRMIGYLPVQIDTITLGGRITYYRYSDGLTPKEFGKLISVDASTVREWENGIHVPHAERNKKSRIF